MMPGTVSNSGWWAQSVAVAYEQHIGRRLPGQAQDGSFQGSTTVTLAADLDGALQRWLEAVDGLDDFNGRRLQGAPSTSSSERWRYWRASFSDGTKTQVDIGLRGDKSSVAISVSKADSAEAVSEWKAFWRQILAEIRG